MNAKPLIVSVVRDFAMYDRCIRNNRFLDGCEIKPIDNRTANDFIGVCYNRALDALSADDERWLVFCHEDFEVREYLSKRLSELDLTRIYGPVGAITVRRFGFYCQWRLIGEIEESDKSGTCDAKVGERSDAFRVVDTLDCQCVIVHTSLLRKFGLRFDEHLSFDLYVEDFCIAARERHGIATTVLPLECHHWSKGSVQPRYYDQIDYLRRKWPHAAYTGTAYQLIGGGGSPLWRLQVWLKRVVQRMLR